MLGHIITSSGLDLQSRKLLLLPDPASLRRPAIRARTCMCPDFVCANRLAHPPLAVLQGCLRMSQDSLYSTTQLKMADYARVRLSRSCSRSSLESGASLRDTKSRKMSQDVARSRKSFNFVAARLVVDLYRPLLLGSLRQCLDLSSRHAPPHGAASHQMTSWRRDDFCWQ